MAASSHPVVILRPSGRFTRLNLGDVWEYRDLLYFLVWRDIKVRYKQTALGAAWAVLQPLLTMVAFSVFFGKLAKVPSNGIPYPVFTFAALLPWQLFSYSMTEAGNSLIGSQNLITKIYFPRLVIPIAAVLGGLPDFAISFAVLLVLMAIYGIVPTLAILTIPLFILLAVATALAAGLWLSALNVKYRDVRYTIPFLAQFWLFLTPVAYPSSLVPARWRLLFGLNPMAGVVEGFRWALLGEKEAPGPMLVVSIVIVAVLLVTGLYYFRRLEATFADTI
ncbi:MAG TPA: ABC transporter permease [Bryobacteraceae bacterium]|jgi:lipopolysaccharide transport system permease protein